MWTELRWDYLLLLLTDSSPRTNSSLIGYIHVYILIGTYSNRGQINMIFANYAATLEQSQRERGGLKHKTKSKVKIELKKKQQFLSKIQMSFKQKVINLVGMISFSEIILSGCNGEYKVGFAYKYYVLPWDYVNCLQHRLLNLIICYYSPACNSVFPQNTLFFL